MKYKVTTTWTVEVTEEEVRRACERYGKAVDPKQLATFKAIQRSIEVVMDEAKWNGGVDVYFDVTPVTN